MRSETINEKIKQIISKFVHRKHHLSPPRATHLESNQYNLPD
jgi:hypothetical protein